MADLDLDLFKSKVGDALIERDPELVLRSIAESLFAMVHLKGVYDAVIRKKNDEHVRTFINSSGGTTNAEILTKALLEGVEGVSAEHSYEVQVLLEKCRVSCLNPYRDLYPDHLSRRNLVLHDLNFAESITNVVHSVSHYVHSHSHS